MIEKLILITVFALFKGRINKTILENFNEKNAPRTGSQQKYQEYTREIHFCTKSIPSSRRRILSSYFDEDTPSVYSISKNHHRQNCFFLSIYRALYQNKHIHVHLIHWRSHDICAIIRNSQVHTPSIALVFYHKLKSRRVINIQLNGIQFLWEKAYTRGKNGGFSTDTASRYTAGIDIYRWIDSVIGIWYFPSRDTLNIFDTSSSFSKSSNFFFYNFLHYAKKENVKNSTVKCIKIKE